MSDNYKAVVVTIKNLRKIEKADRLLATNIFGNNIIVGIDTKEGDRGLYFPVESQLGLEFAQANDLIRRKNPETGKAEGGMFDENRRVRAQIFRGEKSMGFFIPLDSLKKLEQGFDTQIENFKEGDEISEFNGKIISQKYIPKNTRTEGTSKSKSKLNNDKHSKINRIVDGQFKFHKETHQLGQNIHKIKPDDIISITYKYHGTSAIASRILINGKLTWFEKFMNLFGKNYVPKYYDYVYASRNVIKNDSNKDGGYYEEDLWVDRGKKLFEGKLKTGETIYYELVGYTKSGKAIQKGYEYGCSAHSGLSSLPTNKAIVYRITYTLPDNSVVELNWKQLEERCKELGVQSALLLYYGEVANLPLREKLINRTEEQWREDTLKYLQDTYLEKDCIFHNNKVPAEGIVVRIEQSEPKAFKLKSFRFMEGETKALDAGEVDLETEQSQENGEV